ncbi:endonuclease domain-containing protein [Streptomyces sp. NPDC056486]|uniref:endonuclease domain-containing protein n=1 Tax=Streptomyces sp. NPDC056486 TaxID=3345835 RepID=UPI0036CE84D7
MCSKRTPRTLCAHLYKRAGNSGHVGWGCVRCRQCVAGCRAAVTSASAVHVDHRQEAGRVPDVLCFNCISAIGKLGDDPGTVRRAAAYLEGNAWKPTLVAPGVYRLPS